MEVWQQYQKTSRVLNEGVKARVRQAVPLYLARSRALQDPRGLQQAAIDVLKGRFPGSSPAQMDALAFYLLSLVAAGEAGSKQGVESKKAMSEMGEMESLRLQMAMDRHSKFMTTLSNIMKKISDTNQGIIQNIK